MGIIASNGTTWDMIAYEAGVSEFSMDLLIQKNSYSFSDVVAFEGGEVVNIDVESMAVEEKTIKTPWE